MKTKLKELLKENLNDRQRRILISQECLGAKTVHKISEITGIPLNHVYSEMKTIRSVVRTADLVPSTEYGLEAKTAIIYNNISKAKEINLCKSKTELEKESISPYNYNIKYLALYDLYPKKTDKRSGERKYLLLSKKYKHEEILRFIQNYLRTVSDREPEYIKSLAVFLGRDQHYLEYSDEESKEHHIEATKNNPINSLSNILN